MSTNFSAVTKRTRSRFACPACGSRDIPSETLYDHLCPSCEEEIPAETRRQRAQEHGKKPAV